MRESRNRNTMIRPEALFLLALMLLVLPLGWVMGFLTAVAVHELGHYVAVCMCGGRIYSVQIGIRGMVMETSALSCGKELVCALAGPVAGGLMMLFCRRVPEIAICAGVHTVYNLLPIYPMDGGRAFRAVLIWLLPGGAGERVSSIAQKIFCCLLWILVLIISVIVRLKLILFVIPAAVWCYRIGKRPCKQPRKRLQ